MSFLAFLPQHYVHKFSITNVHYCWIVTKSRAVCYLCDTKPEKRASHQRKARLSSAKSAPRINEVPNKYSIRLDPLIHLWTVRHGYISKGYTNLATHQLNCPSAHQLKSSQTNTPVNPLTCRLVNFNPHRLINLNPCQLFGTDFNIKSALFVHQPSTLPQKIDSRGGLFWCQKGAIVHTGKMNIYLDRPPLTPVFGPFSAKCSAFWC